MYSSGTVCVDKNQNSVIVAVSTCTFGLLVKSLSGSLIYYPSWFALFPLQFAHFRYRAQCQPWQLPLNRSSDVFTWHWSRVSSQNNHKPTNDKHWNTGYNSNNNKSNLNQLLYSISDRLCVLSLEWETGQHDVSKGPQPDPDLQRPINHPPRWDKFRPKATILDPFLATKHYNHVYFLWYLPIIDFPSACAS